VGAQFFRLTTYRSGPSSVRMMSAERMEKTATRYSFRYIAIWMEYMISPKLLKNWLPGLDSN